MKEDTSTTPPISNNQIAEPLIHIKHDLYRFPQLLVTMLAQIHDIKETNTFERIRKLKDQGVLDPIFADSLLKAMDHIVKLRVLAQISYGEEFELVSTLGSANFGNEMKMYKDELEDLKMKNPDIDAKIGKCREDINELKAKADAGDAKAKADLTTQEANLKNLEKIGNKIRHLGKRLEDCDKVEKKKLKAPILSTSEVDKLRNETLPVLNKLFKMAEKSISGPSFDFNAFNNP
jgi:hypothetical protein